MKPRILGRHVKLLLLSEGVTIPVDLGELDEFSATSSTEIIKTRPVGYFLQGVTTKYAGYELSFKIAKTNPFIERLNYLADKNLLNGKQPPKFIILETVFHYNRLGPVPIMESWMYRGVTLYGLDINISGEGDYSQEIKGFASYKDSSPIDTTILELSFLPGIGALETVYRIDRNNEIYKSASDIINGILG